MDAILGPDVHVSEIFHLYSNLWATLHVSTVWPPFPLYVCMFYHFFVISSVVFLFVCLFVCLFVFCACIKDKQGSDCYALVGLVVHILNVTTLKL